MNKRLDAVEHHFDSKERVDDIEPKNSADEKSLRDVDQTLRNLHAEVPISNSFQVVNHDKLILVRRAFCRCIVKEQQHKLT